MCPESDHRRDRLGIGDERQPGNVDDFVTGLGFSCCFRQRRLHWPRSPSRHRMQASICLIDGNSGFVNRSSSISHSMRTVSNELMALFERWLPLGSAAHVGPQNGMDGESHGIYPYLVRCHWFCTEYAFLRCLDANGSLCHFRRALGVPPAPTPRMFQNNLSAMPCRLDASSIQCA